MTMLSVKMLSLVAIAMLINVAMATNYSVGGPRGGWDASTNLPGWASSQSFSVGDNLVFQYSPNHDVVEVTKADYDSCQSTNPLKTYNGGNTVVPLTSPGKRYFICGTIGHCSQGMKVEINTLAASALPPASPPATPPLAATAPTPPPAASPLAPVPSPTPESAASTPMESPIFAPTNSPLSSPPKLPVSNPTSSPVVPSTESLTNSSSTGSATPPSSSATKLSTLVGSAVGFCFAMVLLLTL